MLEVECPGRTQCILEISPCDGMIDCDDASDEDEEFCRGLSVFLISIELVQIVYDHNLGLLQVSDAFGTFASIAAYMIHFRI